MGDSVSLLYTHAACIAETIASLSNLDKFDGIQIVHEMDKTCCEKERDSLEECALD